MNPPGRALWGSGRRGYRPVSARRYSAFVPLVGGSLALFGIQRRLELKITFFPLVQRIFLYPFRADFHVVVVAVKNSLGGSAAA
ncbi:hypothetical protein D3C79_970350 [compost metagenome]